MCIRCFQGRSDVASWILRYVTVSTYTAVTGIPLASSTMKTTSERHSRSPRTRVLLLVSVVLALVGSAAARSNRKKKPLLRDGLFKGSKFKRVRAFSDEFNGRFDTKMWYRNNPRWLGRQPGLFVSENVKQRKGRLLLYGRYEEDEEVFKEAPEGYEKYTTAFVQTRKKAKYGYFEVKAKPSNSRLSSSFWGSLDTPKRWTEIDVFELGGGAISDGGVDFRKRINMNLHVFRYKKKGIQVGKNEIAKPSFYRHRSYLRSRFHTYGLDWSKRWITWTFNGRAIRRDRNKHWHQGFPIKFDVETMPHWFGLPSRRTLPAVYKIKYIRAWSRKRRGRDSVQVVQSSGRQLLPVILPVALGSVDTMKQGGNGNEDDDEAVLEVDSENEGETQAPRDGLQRPPIAGSNERVYQPVVPMTGGRRWIRYIEAANARLSDVEGVLIDANEGIDVTDFDEEVLMMRRGGR